MGISKHDKQALADLFIDMGVPLVVAMQTVESWSGETLPLSQKAEKLAKLLNIAVDFATKVTKKLEIRDAYTLENVRGRIIRIVTPIICESYVSGGEEPAEGVLKDLTELFDVLLSFADSVSPTGDQNDKPHQMAMIIEACSPVLSALRNHSFSLPPETLFNKTVESLHRRAETFSDDLNMDDVVQSGLLKAVVKVYVSCYEAAIAKVESGSNLTGDEAIQSIWTDCDERLAMIHGLSRFVGKNVGIISNTSQKAEKPVEEIKSAKQEPVDNEEIGIDQGEDDEGEFNPMSFFSVGDGS